MNQTPCISEPLTEPDKLLIGTRCLVSPKYSCQNNKRSITIVTRTIYKSSHFNFAGQQQPPASAKLGAQISCLMAKHSPDLDMKTIGG